jgi:proliferating cell nuclear antigen
MDCLRELIKQGNFDCSSAGISLQGVDSAFVALIQLTLRAEGFSKYRVDHNMNLGIDIENFVKILKCGGPNDKLTLSCTEQANKLSIQLESPEQDRVSTFDLKLMEIDTDNFGIPATTYKCIVRMPSSEFQRICRELSTLGETVKIAVNKAGIQFSVEGTTGSGTIACKPADGEKEEKGGSNVQIKVEDPIEQQFGLRYLNNFAKAATVSETVTLMLSDSVPFVVEFKFGELGHLRYFLAPKIDDSNAE